MQSVRTDSPFLRLVFFSFFFLFGLAQTARAADEPVSPVTSDQEAAAKILESATVPATQNKISFSYWGAYQGPALAHPTSGGSIDTTSGEFTEGEQNLYNQFRVDFNLTENLFFGPVWNFQLNPFAGSGFYAQDSGMRIGHRHIIHTDNANLYVDFRVMAPLKPSNRAKDELINLQTLNVFTYAIPKTKLTVGFLGFHYYQIYGSGIPSRDPHNPKDPRDLNVYFAPTFSYQVTPSLAAITYVEFYPWHKVSDGWANWNNDPTDIAPGISWDITPNVNLTPQVLFYPGQPDFKHMGTIAYLYAKFF